MAKIIMTALVLSGMSSVLMGSSAHAQRPAREPAPTGMKNCVEYIRGSGIAPYFPVNENGQVDLAKLNEIGIKSKLKYILEGETETITSNEGSNPVTLTVNRKSGRIQEIVSEKSTIYFSLPTSLPSRSLRREQHLFRYQGDTCIPESETVYLNGPGIGGIGYNSVEKTFDIDTCRALGVYFKKYPDLKACANDETVKALQSILTKVAIPRAANLHFDSNLHKDNIWFIAMKKFEICSSKDGIKNTIKDESLWRDSVTSQPGKPKSKTR